MADIELVIKMPEEVYEYIKRRQPYVDKYGYTHVDLVFAAVLNGTPLPKGHGRLIDADSLWNAYHDLDYDFYEAFDLADTIIGADKAESEDKE